MARKLGIALFGLGRHGRSVHFRNLIQHHEINLKYIVEPDTSMASGFLTQQSQSGITILSPTDVARVLNDKTVDAVVITSSNDTHEAYIKSAVAAGKSVLCEKPITPDLSSTQSCYEAAKANGRVLLCGFNRRFDPSISSIHRRIGAGEIGKIKCIRTICRDKVLHPVEYLRKSGGIFADSFIHEFDIAGWFTQSLPSMVYVQGHAWHEELREFGDVDYANVLLKYPSGTVVNIDLARESAYGLDHRMEVHGTNGVCLQRSLVHPTSVTSFQHNGELRENSFSDFCDLWKESFVEELQHFVNVLQGKEDCIVKAETCINTAKIISACNESLRTGQPVQP